MIKPTKSKSQCLGREMSLPVSGVVKDGLAKSLAFANLGESVDFAFCSRIEGSVSPLSISLGDRSKPFPIPVPLKVGDQFFM